MLLTKSSAGPKALCNSWHALVCWHRRQGEVRLECYQSSCPTTSTAFCASVTGVGSVPVELLQLSMALGLADGFQIAKVSIQTFLTTNNTVPNALYVINALSGKILSSHTNTFLRSYWNPSFPTID